MSMFLLAALSSLAEARTLTVGPNGAYDLISDAVVDARDGDVISVAAGRYTEPSFNVGVDVTLELDAGAIVRTDALVLMYGLPGAHIVIEGGEWQDAIQGVGGSLSVHDARFTLDGSIASYSSVLSVSASTFSGGEALGVTGVFSFDSDGWIEDCLFEGSVSGGSGAVGVSGGLMIIAGSTFEDNSSDRGNVGSGAAIWAQDADVIVSDSDFSGNDAFYGGAIHHEGEGDLSVDGCTFFDNTAAYGGAIFFTGFGTSGSLTVDGSTFIGNATENNGGGINAYYADEATISDSSFAGNYAPYYGSAAVFIGVGGAVVDGVDIDGDDAYWGAVGVSDVDGFVMSNSRIADHGSGDGLYVASSETIELVDNLYEDNADGSAFLADFEVATSTRERYCRGNDAFTSGGLVAQNGDGLWVENALFDANNGVHGAGLYVYSVPDVVVENSSFLSNWARGAGAIYVNNSTLDFRNNLVAYTVAGNGLYLENSSFVLGSSAWWDNTSADVDGDVRRPTGVGHVFTDPELVGWTAGSCRVPGLGAGSPLVDAGVGDDVDGSGADIGAGGGSEADPGLFTDADGDGVAGASDCDDADDDVHPGAVDACNGVDDDCDGAIDAPVPAAAPTWFRDSDRDGYGDPSDSRRACEAQDLTGFWVSNDDDCGPADGDVHPGAVETCDGVDQDCDGAVDDAASDAWNWFLDDDGDGFGDAGDVVADCDPVAGRVRNNRDCDDGSTASNPDADEICDRDDNDCDGATDEAATDAARWYEDGDGDGVGDGPSTLACDPPRGFVATKGDCDDGDAATFPGAPESCADGAEDRNCDGSTGRDDGDGDGSVACDDCDDDDDDVHPGAAEVWYDGVDQDCDGASDFDADADGAAAVPWGEDCDDTDGSVRPGVREIVGDDVDSDCDGEDPAGEATDEEPDPEPTDDEATDTTDEENGRVPTSDDDDLQIAGCGGCDGGAGGGAWIGVAAAVALARRARRGVVG